MLTPRTRWRLPFVVAVAAVAAFLLFALLLASSLLELPEAWKNSWFKHPGSLTGTGDGGGFGVLSPEELEASIENNAIQHINVTSSMTQDGNYFRILFTSSEHAQIESYNPNIIPHPYRNDTYIIVAQRDKRNDDNDYWYTSLVCEAVFQNDTLRCNTPPMNIPIAATRSDKCTNGLKFFQDQLGPRDARIFYGPSAPYIVYGSQGTHHCLSQYVQDLRRVVDWGVLSPDALDPPDQPFLYPTELQRPRPNSLIEKNWFLFWDLEDNMYVHYDTRTDRRAFAKLNTPYDGSVGRDLAPLTAAADKRCMSQYFPKLKSTGLEWLHQSTNSLSITLCSRSSPTCHKTADNTFIFAIIQHKTFYIHGLYEPYIMLFDSSPPFALRGISSKPFWIPGRGEPNGAWKSPQTAKSDPHRDRTWVPDHQSQMLFILSMSWKAQGMTYHGYMDDELFISFGVEDSGSAGIAVKAGDLITDLHMCD